MSQKLTQPGGITYIIEALFILWIMSLNYLHFNESFLGTENCFKLLKSFTSDWLRANLSVNITHKALDKMPPP